VSQPRHTKSDEPVSGSGTHEDPSPQSVYALQPVATHPELFVPSDAQDTLSPPPGAGGHEFDPTQEIVHTAYVRLHVGRLPK
jgi:hypothetical protein